MVDSIEHKDRSLYLFLHDKPTRIILSLNESSGKYASIISKETDCTYTHTLKILSHMQELGIVKFKKTGRIKTVTLTSAGLDIAHNIEGLVRQFGKLSEEKQKKKKSVKKSRK